MDVSTYQRIQRRVGDEERIIASNFLFNSSYTIIFLHPFFYLRDADLSVAIVLGMAIFGSLQVGGFFILELFAKKYSTSLEVMLLMRGLATVLLAIPRADCILIGFALLGLSHSMFFVGSRMSLGRLKASDNTFFKLSLSTNLAYFIMPGIGALIIKYWSLPYVALVFSLMFSMGSYRLLKQAQSSEALIAEDDNAGYENAISVRTIIYDCVLFAFFVLPYTIMMSLVSIKTFLAGYDATYSSMLFSVNSIVVIAFLFAYMGVNLRGDVINMRSYLAISLLASALCVGGLFAGYAAFVCIFVVWSICEAYQGPTIEEHVFSTRKYSKKQLKWIVGVDGVCSFIGPVVAGNAFFGLS
jgi:MFS family permease